MAIYVISDLHLSFGTNKPMDIFGDKWKDYEEKIKTDWLAKVTPSDYVILAGDFSWAMYLEESIEDFKFLNSLPGKKILLKGNHDYWWETVTKMENFLKENNFENIYFLHNNCIETEDYLICGTRYWAEEENQPNDKIFHREIERAKLSLNCALNKFNENCSNNQNYPNSQDAQKPIIMVTHYPPDNMLINALKEYPIKKWIYAHIHSNYEESKVEINGIDTYLTSCDYLDFKLIKIA